MMILLKWAGVAVGGGWQASVAYINLFCYYVIGLPLGFVLGYKTRLGVQVKLLTGLPLVTWLVLDGINFYGLIIFPGDLDWYDMWDYSSDSDPCLHDLHYQLDQRGNIIEVKVVFDLVMKNITSSLKISGRTSFGENETMGSWIW